MYVCIYIYTNQDGIQFCCISTWIILELCSRFCVFWKFQYYFSKVRGGWHWNAPSQTNQHPTNQAIPSVKCPGKAWPNAVALRWRRNSIPTNLHVRWHGGNAWKKWQKAIMLWLWNGLEDEFFQEGGWLLLVFQSQNAARGRINYAHGIMGTLKIPWSWSHDLHVWAPIMPIIFMGMIPHGSPFHNASLRGTVGCTSLFSNPLEGRRIPGWMGGSKCCPHISLSSPAHEDVKDVVLMQVPSIVLCLGTGVFSVVELWGVKLKWKQVWMETIGGKYTLRLRANII